MRNSIRFILIALLAIGLVKPLVAQRAGSFEFSGSVGAMYLDGSFAKFFERQGFANNDNRFIPAAGVRVGYNIDNHWGFGVGVVGARETHTDGKFPYIVTNGAKYLTPSANVTYTANLNARFSPFITGGTQFTRITGHGQVTHPTWGTNLGLGVRAKLGEYTALRIEAGMAAEHYAELSRRKTAYNSTALIGLSVFTHGRKVPAPVQLPARVDTLWRTPACNCPKPPAPAPPPPPPIVLKDTLVLEGVNFEFNQSVLTADAKEILNRVAAELWKAEWSNTRWEIAGHTSSIGSKEYNQALSQRRAESVKAYLATRGVAASRLVAKGYGETQPKYPEVAEGDNWKNRRVELRRIH